MRLYTTFNLLREAGPCVDGYKKLRRSLPMDWDRNANIDLLHILGSNGIDDALWALRAVLPEQAAHRDKVARDLAVRFAARGLPMYETYNPGDGRMREVVDAAKALADGKVGGDGVDAARIAAKNALDAAIDAATKAETARVAALDSVWAARAALYSASADIAVDVMSVAMDAALAYISPRRDGDIGVSAYGLLKAFRRDWQVKLVRRYLGGDVPSNPRPCKSCWWQEGDLCYNKNLVEGPAQRGEDCAAVIGVCDRDRDYQNKRRILERLIPGDRLGLRSERNEGAKPRVNSGKG